MDYIEKIKKYKLCVNINLEGGWRASITEIDHKISLIYTPNGYTAIYTPNGYTAHGKTLEEAIDNAIFLADSFGLTKADQDFTNGVWTCWMNGENTKGRKLPKINKAKDLGADPIQSMVDIFNKMKEKK